MKSSDFLSSLQQIKTNATGYLSRLAAFLKYQDVPSIPQTMLNIKPPKQIFQTCNVFPAEDLAIDIEGC
jgi:hypothetical protein